MCTIFDTLREEVPLDRVLEVNGHKSKVSCVAHDDATPSMHLYDEHVYCFGCGFHGDVVDVWSAKRGIARPIEAAMDLAREFNIELPEASFGAEAHEKAEERRRKQVSNFQLAKICHNTLKKHPHVREWWEGRGFTPSLQERFLLGTNRDGTEAVIPFWNRSRVQGLIRRKLRGEPKYVLPKAQEFVDGYRPLFIPGPLKGDIFVVEGYVDALAVVVSGSSVIAVGGTDISEVQVKEFRRLLSKGAHAHALPDGDESGIVAARGWARRLYPRVLISEPDYGAEHRKDVADLFAETGAEKTGEHLARLPQASEDLIEIETRIAKDLGSPRRRFDYAAQAIVPLAARISSESARAAALGIVAKRLDGVDVAWLKKAVGEELERLEKETLQQLIRGAEQEEERQREEHRKKVEGVQGEIDALFVPGVLERLRDIAAKVHRVERDEKPLEMAILIALSAQLANLPNGRPSGTSALLTADAGRGKNHLADAAVELLPPEFYLTFEIASGQSLYYAAAEDPDFLKHKFVYPNEIEGVEALIEFLRPMLSKGWCRKFVTDKDASGRNVMREIIVEGPATTIIPTIRNKTDDQLQTRLLMAELEDYVGRVKIHSRAISNLYRPDHAAADYSHERFLWREGLRQLTLFRRVVFRIDHPDFAYDDDQVSHGARLWANLLGLMSAHAWLEQKNRKIIELAKPGEPGEQIIEATPDDYEAAYTIFTKVCERSVINLSDTHRKIAQAVYDLQGDDPTRDGFTTREIGAKGSISHQAVSKHKTFLISSAKLLKEVEGSGLALVAGAEPSWWEGGDLTKGIPTPEQVHSWWNPPPDPSKPRGQRGQAAKTQPEPDTYAENSVHDERGQGVDTSTPSHEEPEGVHEDRGHGHGLSTKGVDSENGSGKPNTGSEEGLSTVSTVSSFCAHNASIGARCVFCEEENAVREYLKHPSPSFEDKAKEALQHYPDLPERVVNNLASEVAYEVFSDAPRGKRARPLVKDKLEEMQRSS